MSLKKNKNCMYYDELKNDNIRLDNKFFLKKLLIQNCNKKKFIIKKTKQHGFGTHLSTPLTYSCYYVLG